MPTKIIMPQLGESVVEGTVTNWLKQEGDTVEEFESLVEVNTDKVDTEIPSSASGTLLKIVVQAGTTVTAGTTLAWVGQPGEEIPAEDDQETPPAATAKAEEAAPAAPQPEGVQPAPPPQTRDLGFISPVVARLAKDKNVDLNQVKGTGQGDALPKKMY